MAVAKIFVAHCGVLVVLRLKCFVIQENTRRTRENVSQQQVIHVVHPWQFKFSIIMIIIIFCKITHTWYDAIVVIGMENTSDSLFSPPRYL